MGQLQDKQQVIYKDLGRIDYQAAWDLQTSLNQRLIQWKRGEKSTPIQPHYLLLCEHPPVYTLGKSGSEDHLKINAKARNMLNVSYYRINRGGDITYHGPGQVVGYPIFDLDRFFTDVHKYVRYLEEVIIRLLKCYDLEGQRLKDFTGVWLSERDQWRKICAIGVHLSRWVTMHGFALNVNTELSYYDHIVPCGIDARDKTVTSIAQEINRKVEVEEVKLHLRRIFAEVFDYSYIAEEKTETQ